MNVRLSLMCAALALTAAGPACAASYDLLTNFGSSVFSYGGGTNGADFAVFTNPAFSGCGPSGVVCYDFANSSGFPFVAKNESGTPYTFFPTNALSFQPDGADGDALIRFSAPTAGIYTISGFTAAEDPNGGQGQTVSIYDSVAGVSTSLYSTVLDGAVQASTPFNNLTAVLGAGDTITFGVSGQRPYTTSGIDATIQFSPNIVSSVPEPATWAMMIFGMGLVGFAARRRQKVAPRVYFA